MFTAIINRSNATVLATSILATAACFAIATTPASAGEKQAFKAQVERSIATTMRMPEGQGVGIVTVAVTLNADGSVASADVANSSGIAAYDREALRTAQTIRYPAGAARTVAMVLGFGREVTAAEQGAAGERVTALRTDRRRLLAGEPKGRPAG